MASATAMNCLFRLTTRCVLSRPRTMSCSLTGGQDPAGSPLVLALERAAWSVGTGRERLRDWEARQADDAPCYAVIAGGPASRLDLDTAHSALAAEAQS